MGSVLNTFLPRIDPYLQQITVKINKGTLVNI